MKKSRVTRSKKTHDVSTQERKNGRFNRTAQAWKEVPLGFKMGKDGKLRKRVGPPTKGEVLAGRFPHRAYDLIFQDGGQATPRTYRVLFTNFIDPDKSFETELVASSLKHLFRQLPFHIATLRNPKVTHHFTVSFKRVTLDGGVAEEIIHVPLGQPLEESQRPVSINGPLQLEED